VAIKKRLSGVAVISSRYVRGSRCYILCLIAVRVRIVPIANWVRKSPIVSAWVYGVIVVIVVSTRVIVVI
jgi:hypothetical protein